MLLVVVVKLTTKEIWISFSAQTCLILKLAEAVMTCGWCYGDDRFESRPEQNYSDGFLIVVVSSSRCQDSNSGRR